MDGGANCHVLNDIHLFILFYKKEIDCTLACGEKTRFQGVGIAVVEIAPELYVVLAPCYLAAQDDVCTISTGALKQYSKCKRATHEAMESLFIETAEGKCANIKTQVASGLDYVRLCIHHFRQPLQTKSQRNPHLLVKPKLVFRSLIPNHNNELPKPEVHAAALQDRSQLAAYLHLKFGHQNMDYICQSIKNGHIKGLPKNIPDLKYDCPVCKIAAAPQLPRGNPVDHTPVRKGVRFHADFAIINCESICLFKSVLLIVELTTHQKWAFTTLSRNPPIQIMSYFVGHLRRQGYPVLELRVDKDGALARSTNFMHLIVKVLQMTVQTTGG